MSNNIDLTGLTTPERFDYFMDNGVAFNLYVHEVEEKFQDEYACVCMCAGRHDLVDPE
jgi:hypothetical protein